MLQEGFELGKLHEDLRSVLRQHLRRGGRGRRKEDGSRGGCPEERRPGEEGPRLRGRGGRLHDRAPHAASDACAHLVGGGHVDIGLLGLLQAELRSKWQGRHRLPGQGLPRQDGEKARRRRRGVRVRRGARGDLRGQRALRNQREREPGLCLRLRQRQARPHGRHELRPVLRAHLHGRAAREEGSLGWRAPGPCGQEHRHPDHQCDRRERGGPQLRHPHSWGRTTQL
mmetsp:Transcript_129788/g.361632  ORF Transcript_129788/g.361632 Transcript_129788/m.361632 type:complete len:227 (-) Transcript_129788:471-1151(-)